MGIGLMDSVQSEVRVVPNLTAETRVVRKNRKAHRSGAEERRVDELVLPERRRRSGGMRFGQAQSQRAL
jgi:hypothetical protein